MIPQGLGAIDEIAVALHEIYESFVRAGFDRSDAFELVRVQWGQVIAGSIND